MNALEQARRLIESALAALDAERAVINDLNVYPVPDGDTGTNLFLTVRAVRDELGNTPDADLAAVAGAVTRGSLMGARGNSGVILSQIVRGACKVCGDAESFGTPVIQALLAEGTSAAYRAVKKPVEGTMLTVIREMSAAADRMPTDSPVPATLQAVLTAGRVAVDRTTSQLAALRQAGVVDAGGYGLLVICRGLAEALDSEDADAFALAAAPTGAAPVIPHDMIAGADMDPDSRYRYCTSFLITGDNLDQEATERFLEPIGDSALVVGDDRMLKIHIHTDDPGEVLSWATQRGAISEIEINDMREQTRQRDERLQSSGDLSVVVAVVAGEGNKSLYREMGARGIVEGGQSMNPSAAQLLEVVEDLDCDQVVVLPNNKNVILTAEQAASMSDRTLVVVPTRSITAGITALVEFDPLRDAVSNAGPMTETLARAHTAEVTVAVRDSAVGEIAVQKGQAIGLVDGELVAAASSLPEALGQVLTALGQFQPEVVTVLTSLNGYDYPREHLAAAVADAFPDAETVLHDGGQPLYPILIGVE